MIYGAPLAALIGLCLGSFSATAALRLARGEQAAFGRSACDHCNAPLNYWRTLPVIAYVHQNGACSDCGGRIDPVHLAGEICGAAILSLCCTIASPMRAIGIGVLGLVLLTSAVVDAKSRRLPDVLSLATAAICAALALAGSQARLIEGLIAGALSFVVLESVRLGFLYWRGRAGLGFGDVKLVAALALWLGLATPWAVALAAAFGLIAMAALRPSDGRLAFGPALALAGWSAGFVREAGLWPGLN